MSDAAPTREPVLALVRDLLLASRITATARSLSVPVELVRDPNQLGGRSGRMLLVDLNLAGAIEVAAAWKGQTGREVIGFVSHVDADTIARARGAGLDRVLARSAFVQQVDALLSACDDD